MTTFFTANKFHKDIYHVFIQKYGIGLFLITLLGFGLRFYRVGEDSFWYDEVGQAIAAIQPRFADMLLTVRQHAGAMPLDYLISRLMASISLSETVMRFPSVVWGTLSIPACYLLLCQFDIPNKKQTAILVALMVSISPVNIQYSQEMRFYPALMLFYTLSTLFLMKAIKAPLIKNWLVYILITSFGMYFHPYVLLAGITGAILILQGFRLRGNYRSYFDQKKDTLVGFLYSTIILMIIFLPGYLFFVTGEAHRYNLDFNINTILCGLGLRATRLSEGMAFFGPWHYIQIGGMVAGLLFLIAKFDKYRSVSSFLISSILQISIIVYLDFAARYPFVLRQIIHLAPVVMLLTCISFLELLALVKPPAIKKTLIILLITTLGLSSMPYTNAIYYHSKGSTREIAQKITDEYRTGQRVLILSSEYALILKYYLVRFENPDKDLPVTLVAEDIAELEHIYRETPKVYFIAVSKDADGETRRQIVKFGFKPFVAQKEGDFLFIYSP